MTSEKFTLAAFADEAASPAEGQIAAMKRNGLSHIEVRNVDGISCADLTPEQSRELRKRFDGAGIKVRTVGSPIGKVRITDSFEKETDRFLRICETAEILGADKIRIFSFYRDDTVPQEAAEEEALRRLRALSERAGDLILCHENEKGIYGEGWEFCKHICTEIPRIKAVFDPANFIQCGVDTLRAWEELKEFTEYLHLKDSRPDRIIVPCGDGVGHVPFILGDYIDRGGRFATLEPHLANFTAKKLLEREASNTCGYAYATCDDAFDAAVVAVRAILDTKGVSVQ